MTEANHEELPPFEDFIRAFSEKYNEGETFKVIVHQYMKISPIRVLSLKFRKRFFPNWYQRASGSIVSQYASKIYGDLIVASELEKEQREDSLVQQNLEERALELSAAEIEATQAQGSYEQVTGQANMHKKKVEEDYSRKIAEEQRAAEEAAAEIAIRTEAALIAKQQLEQRLHHSALIKFETSGALTYNLNNLEKKLEEIFLNEVLTEVAGIGSGAYLSKIKREYEGSIGAYVDVIEDFGELPNMSYPESIIYSRTRGYRNPSFPFIMVQKPSKAESSERAAADSAIAIDISGSMDENNRFAAAQKTALAHCGLMHKLDPKNNAYLGVIVYNNVITEVTGLQLLRDVRPSGGTLTELALDWIIEKLEHSRPGIGYLYTDGLPNNLDKTIKSARNFRNYPNIMLRIFFIDGNPESEKIIKDIGKAAGPATKVIPVKNYQLASGAIRDLAEVIKGAYSISSF